MQARRGQLKVYLGFAPGVGKTFRLLEEARALRARGADVVLGAIEPRGRPETLALLEGLERVAARRFEYRGLAVEEMDLEAVLRRRPAIAVVDDLAHVNAPGSRHPYRHQDVFSLLDAGIQVIGALDVQQLDRVAALARRATGIAVRDTVPESVVRQADQVVALDLSAEELRERLREGKILPPDRIAGALEGLFKADTLAALRELNLREVAELLDRSFRTARARERPRPSGPGGHVMVCLSSNPPHALTLLHRGSQMAGRLDTSWYCVYVETPLEAPDRIDARAQQQLISNVEQARGLGAEVVRLRGKDVSASLLEFARAHRVSTLLVGRSRRTRWQRLLQRSVVDRLLREAEGFDLHIVSFEGEEDR